MLVESYIAILMTMAACGTVTTAYNQKYDLDDAVPMFYTGASFPLVSWMERLRAPRESACRLKRSAVKHLIELGKTFFKWNRGRQAMSFFLKDAKRVSSAGGFDEYIKFGGSKRAAWDFNKAGLNDISNHIEDTPDGKVEKFYGFAGDVVVILRFTEPGADLWVNEPPSDYRKRKAYMIKYIGRVF